MSDGNECYFAGVVGIWSGEVVSNAWAATQVEDSLVSILKKAGCWAAE